MPRLTVQSLINEGVHTLMNVCPTDPRFYAAVNTFQQRALLYGRWWGTTQLAEFCITPDCQGACIIMPREVAVIEAMTLNGVPILPKNAWYSYVFPVCPAPASCGYGPQALYPWGQGYTYGPWPVGGGISEDKLQVPTFGVTATGETMRFYFNSADIGKTVIVQGYDENRVWKRSSIDGEVQDGELVTFAQTGGQNYTDTTTAWYVGSPTALIKEVTDYNVMAYAVDSGTVGQQLGNFQPSETHPGYRKFYLPGNIATCGDSTASLRCIVSLQHIPVSQPNDWLLFENIPAYEDGIQAVYYWREGDRAQGDAYFFGGGEPARNGRGVIRYNKRSGAIPTLQAELRKLTGDLTTIQVRRSGLNLAGFV